MCGRAFKQSLNTNAKYHLQHPQAKSHQQCCSEAKNKTVSAHSHHRPETCTLVRYASRLPRSHGTSTARSLLASPTDSLSQSVHERDLQRPQATWWWSSLIVLGGGTSWPMSSQCPRSMTLQQLCQHIAVLYTMHEQHAFVFRSKRFPSENGPHSYGWLF